MRLFLWISPSSSQGTIEFSGILYLPGMAPFDQQQAQLKSRSIKLYVKRVFISDEFDDDLMPRYLNFVKVRGLLAVGLAQVCPLIPT